MAIIQYLIYTALLGAHALTISEPSEPGDQGEFDNDDDYNYENGTEIPNAIVQTAVENGTPIRRTIMMGDLPSITQLGTQIAYLPHDGRLWAALNLEPVRAPVVHQTDPSSVWWMVRPHRRSYSASSSEVASSSISEADASIHVDAVSTALSSSTANSVSGSSTPSGSTASSGPPSSAICSLHTNFETSEPPENENDDGTPRRPKKPRWWSRPPIEILGNWGNPPVGKPKRW